jgi:hypothetical protein
LDTNEQNFGLDGEQIDPQIDQGTILLVAGLRKLFS